MLGKINNQLLLAVGFYLETPTKIRALLCWAVCGYLVGASPYPQKSVIQKCIVKWLFTLGVAYREMLPDLPTVWFSASSEAAS